MQTQVYILFAVKAGGKSSNCFGAGHHPRQHRSKNKVTSLVDTDYGQNQFFYDAAEGLVSSIILLIAEYLPPDHKARWFAKAALNSAEQAMVSVLSTVLSRLNAFLDSGMEQILCFDTAIDAEKFCNEKSALFVVLPEEDLTKYFMVSLMIQQLYREI